MFAEWAQRLDDLGLDAEADALGPARGGVRCGVLHLARGTKHRDYALRYGENVPLSAVGASEDGRAPFVLTTYVAPKTVDAFRRAGVGGQVRGHRLPQFVRHQSGHGRFLAGTLTLAPTPRF